MSWWTRRRQYRSEGDSQRLADEVQAARESRRGQTAGRRDLVAEVSRILFATDPIGLDFETNTDEYDSEAETIVIALPAARNVEDVHAITFETFVQWFDADTAGKRETYGEPALRIWQAWIRYEAAAGRGPTAEADWARARDYFRERISPMVKSIVEEEDPWDAYEGVAHMRGLMLDDLEWLTNGGEAFVAWANLEDTFETGKTPVEDAHKALRDAAVDWLNRSFDTPDDLADWAKQAQAATLRLRDRDGDWWQEPS